LKGDKKEFKKYFSVNDDYIFYKGVLKLLPEFEKFDERVLKPYLKIRASAVDEFILKEKVLDYELLAKFWLKGIIRQQLKKYLEFGVEWDYTDKDNKNEFCLEGVPLGLIGIIWFQFTKAVGGNSDWKFCPICGDIIEINPKMNNSKRVFCGDACKSINWEREKS